MHRQAMLVSLSLSPASTAAKNDKHWAFLEDIDAPQWADLKAEEALAKAGTVGDDPWFYRSHSHHEVPLTEITGGHAAETKDPYSASIRTPELERKKNRATSKAKLAFDGTTAAKSKDAGREYQQDESPRADFSSGCHETFGEPPRDRIASPVLCKSPERFSFARRFMSSATSDDRLGGNDRTGVLESLNLRLNFQENQYGQMSTQPDVSVSNSSARQSAEVSEVEDKPALSSISSISSIPWLDTIFSRLNDTNRLRKSLGSALRVKIDDSADNSGTKRQEADTLPKSRLVRQSVQLEASVVPVISGSETESTSLENDNGVSSANCHSDRVRPGDGVSGLGPTSRLGINSSVEAFDDIRKIRKSWGSALRVKVSDEPAVEDASSKHEVSEVSPVSDAREDRKSDISSAASSLKLDKLAADFPSVVDMKAIRTGSEEKKLPGIKVPSIVRANERREHNPIDRRKALGSVKELEVGSSKVPTAVAKKNFRRSVSFDHTPSRGTDKAFISSSRSNLIQQKQGPRASPTSARSNGPANKVGTVSRLSKGGKENTSVHSSTQSKLNPEPSVGSPRISRQSVTRMSMPSLTFAAHARAAMRENGGSNLKPGNNGVVESNRSDSSKAATSAAISALKKSVTPLENVSRKKSAAPPAPVTNPPPKMVTRQSALRSSMPVFSSAAIKQVSKPAPETGVAHKHEEKKVNKIGNGDAELAALLAEHNRKFRPKPKYEPRIHSVKDIREWEARTGQLFYNLLPADRERVNQEISAAKQTRPKHVPC